VLGIERSGSNLEDEGSLGGCPGEAIQLVARQLVKGQVVGDLDDLHVGLNRQLEQAEGVKGDVGQGIAPDADRPWEGPGRYAESHVGRLLVALPASDLDRRARLDR
jgi:hypothetical protein